MVSFAYGTDQDTCEAEARKLLDNAGKHFRRLERHLEMQYPDHAEEGRRRAAVVRHLIADDFTVPDFSAWEVLDQFDGLCRRFGWPDCLGVEAGEKKGSACYPLLREFKDNFIWLPANEDYAAAHGLGGGTTTAATTGSREDAKTIVLPYNNPYARFGSHPDPTLYYRRGQEEAPWRSRGVTIVQHARRDAVPGARGNGAASNTFRVRNLDYLFFDR